MKQCAVRETRDAEEWISRWNLDEVSPETAELLRVLQRSAQERPEMGFIGQIAPPGADKDATPSVFYRASNQTTEDGRQAVDWVFGVSFRKEWGFGAQGAGQHPHLFPGPVLQIHTAWGEYGGRHVVPKAFKQDFFAPDHAKSIHQIVRGARLSEAWPRPAASPRGPVWRWWSKNRELVIFGRGFPNLVERMVELVCVLDRHADARRSG